MIGIIRVSEIPKMLISLLAGIALIGGYIAILAHFPRLAHLPEGVLLVLFLLLLWASFAIGDYVWQWVEDHSTRPR